MTTTYRVQIGTTPEGRPLYLGREYGDRRAVTRIENATVYRTERGAMQVAREYENGTALPIREC